MSSNSGIGRFGTRRVRGVSAAPVVLTLAVLAAVGLAGVAHADGVLGKVREQQQAGGNGPPGGGWDHGGGRPGGPRPGYGPGPGPGPGYGRPPLPSLPPGYRTYRYAGRPYYYHGGHWYAPGYGGYGWIAPPVGLVVDVLPFGYSTLWIGGTSYYYLDDVYYTYRPNVGYVVVQPPAGANAVRSATAGNDDLYIYPKNGQSEAQQATDRYDCHRWAKSQTNFDPTEPAGGVAASETGSRRAEYQRAMTACLEGRGYTVR